MRRLLAALAIVLLTTACGDQVVPPPDAALTTSDLFFFRFQPDAFQNAPRQASFWAVKGQDRSLVLRYQDNNAEFLRFEVGAQSLAAGADGLPFQNGDSVLISVRLADDGTMVFRFAPSGLTFSSSSPARLTISYERASDDVDNDSDVDSLDRVFELRGSIWQQESPLLPWLKLPTVRLLGESVQAKVLSFTGFAMAAN